VRGKTLIVASLLRYLGSRPGKMAMDTSIERMRVRSHAHDVPLATGSTDSHLLYLFFLDPDSLMPPLMSLYLVSLLEEVPLPCVL
jgi:hypothetical protein